MIRHLVVSASAVLVAFMILDALYAQCPKECRKVLSYQSAAGTTVGLCKQYGCANNPNGHAPSNKFWAPNAVVANLADDGGGSVADVSPVSACQKKCPNDGYPQEVNVEGVYTLVNVDATGLQCKKCVTGS